jgi:hypothetical protein
MLLWHQIHVGKVRYVGRDFVLDPDEAVGIREPDMFVTIVQTHHAVFRNLILAFAVSWTCSVDEVGTRVCSLTAGDTCLGISYEEAKH